MIDTLIAGIRFVLDPLFNPLLYLGQDSALIITAIFEALMVVYIRKWTTPQETLQRIMQDRGVQKHLAGLASARGDHAQAKKHKAMRAEISLKGLRYELLPLFLSVPAVLILAAWGYAHLPYRPAAADTSITVNLYSTSLSRAGEVVSLDPQDGLTIVDGPVRTLRAVTDPKETLGLPPYSMATWTIKAEATTLSPKRDAVPEQRNASGAVIVTAVDETPAVTAPRTYTLTFREGERAHQHQLIVGGRLFADAIMPHLSTKPSQTSDAPPEITTEVKLDDFRLFGYIKQPTISPPQVWIFASMPTIPEMPPWMFAYVLVILPFYFLWKRVLKVA